MIKNLDEVKTSFIDHLRQCNVLQSLESLHINYLGRKGIINNLLSQIKNAPLAEKKKMGTNINIFKTFVENSIAQQKEKILRAQKDTWTDVTLPGRKKQKGSLHLVTTAIEEIARIFERLGFIRVSYPEVEWEHFAFETLNMPKNHPARDDFETFFIDCEENKQYGKVVLTPHTSSGQVREMIRVQKPPIKMINIAKCYRRNWDLTHTPMFHQFEGLCVDEGINITHLKGTIEYFVREFFGKERTVRFRPFHFQFTEPSFELDISCDICGGSGKKDDAVCRVCKSGWLELGGAGMVHPHVLRSGNIDSEKYTGWAFGFGVERNSMMKAGLKLDDLRVLYSGDIRFLRQF